MKLLGKLLNQYSSTIAKSYSELVDQLEPAKGAKPLPFEEREIRLLTRPFFEALCPDLVEGKNAEKKKVRNRKDYQDRKALLSKMHLPDEEHEYFDETFEKANKITKQKLELESILVKQMYLNQIDRKAATKFFYESRRMMYKLSLHLKVYEQDRIDPILDLVHFIHTVDKVGIIDIDGEKRIGYTTIPAISEELKQKMIASYEALTRQLGKITLSRKNRYKEMGEEVLTAI